MKTFLNLSVELMVSTCICREKLLEPIFFISPFYENLKFEDVYVYCIPGEPESFGIYDEYEIFDNLLIQHVLQIPNSLMIPLLDESVIEKDTCLDKDGFPTVCL
uniref:Uncharacterized protein n=1 Tax=Panagrolaimus superbus TaxID=310955 RepID=A0A914YW91_9BILA